MKLEIGTRLGHYEILEPIGGDLGERYKATDTRANRLVALTILPPGFAARADTRARLERDARALAALPDAPLSGALEIGHVEPATDFVVSDLVAGETLAARLARGRPELTEALAIALGIAEALDQAHRGGVVHSGLTPASVLLTERGPQLVDFGLAPVLEAIRAALQPPAAAKTQGAPAVTHPRHALPAAIAPATAAYQAPERLAGAAADTRSDLFSCGAILYELVTGRPAFAEKTSALLIAAVQTVDPEPVSQSQPLAPPALDHVVARCLAKDPAERLQTARDLAHQLRWVLEGGSQLGVPAPVAARRRTRERLTWATAAAGLLLAVGLAPAAWRQLTPVPDAPVVRFPLSGLPTAGTPMGVSPDGRWIVSVPAVAQGNGMIGVPLDAVTPEWLNTENTVYHSFWSPDSRSLGFWEGGFVKAVDLAGGAARTLAPASGAFGGGTWGRDGVIVFSSGGSLWRVSDKGGEPVPVTALDESLGETEHLEPNFLPDGRHFLYVAIAAESAVYLASLDSAERTRLFAADSGPVYAAPGYILFNRGNALFAQPFDAEERTLTGDPIRVADGLLMMGVAPGLSPSLARSAVFAASQTGVLVFRTAGGAAGATGAAAPRVLEWRDRSGRATPLGPEAAYAGIDLAPNGTTAAVHVHSSEGGDVFTLDFAQGRLQRLTLDASQHNSSPVWAPDGRRIAFASRRNGLWGLYVKRADGAGAEERIYESPAEKVPMSWSPDGNLLVYAESGDIWAVGTSGEGQPRPIVQSPSFDAFPTVSPAGGWIAYTSADTGRPEVYVQQFPEGPTRRQVSIDSGLWPRWRDDGRELYFNAQGTASILASTIDIDGDAVQPGVPREVFTIGGSPSLASHSLYHRYAVSADGERLLVSRPTTGGAGGGLDTQIAALADAGTQSGAGGNSNVVVLNWPRMIEAR
jgi:eukaryotic-like serine/threonine-protein kinase